MLLKVRHIVLIVLLAAIGVKAQNISWKETPTSIWHTFIIPDIQQLPIEQDTLLAGDMIGAFYDSAGVLKCGGVYTITGKEDSIVLKVYGKDGNKAGFNEGENVIFRIYIADKECVIENVDFIFENDSSGQADVFQQYAISRVMYVHTLLNEIYYPGMDLCKEYGVISPSLYADFPEDMQFRSQNGLNLDSKTGTIDLTSSIPGKYTVYFESSACLMLDSVNLVIHPQEDLLASTDTFFCEGGEVEILPAPGMTGYYWSDGATSVKKIITEPGWYWIEARSSSTNCISRDSIYVKEVKTPSVIVNKTLNCESLLLTAKNSSYSYTINGINTDQYLLTESSDVVIHVVDNHGCSAVDTIFYKLDTLQIKDILYSSVDATCNYMGKIIIDSTSVSGGTMPYSFRFSGNTNLDEYTGYQYETELPKGDYTMYVSDANGCEKKAISSVVISKSSDCEYPVITPDNDGDDDQYYIAHEGTARIYDKHGRIVKNRFNVPDYWDGNDEDGNSLPIGSYIIVVNGDTTINITILK
jgi:hypothetical protein